MDGKAITKMLAVNNTVIHLAKSGPRILIRLGIVDPKTVGKKAIPNKSRLPEIPDLATSKMTFLTARIIQKLEKQNPDR